MFVKFEDSLNVIYYMQVIKIVIMIFGFWNKLPKKFCGLAPMDGVTDFLYRHVMRKFGGPDLVFTEFTSVEGIAHNAVKLLRDFEYDESERPIIAQVFGIDPDSFYTTAIIVCQLGFDGIDINMGCPAKKVSNRGGGAALINNPTLASEIIEAVKSGVRDYSNGRTIEDIKMKQKMKTAILEQVIKHPTKDIVQIPVSVKTRIGVDKIITEDWISHLLGHDLSAITIHGRTLNQMYSGKASWEEIGKASNLIKQTKTKVVGNGDVLNRKDGEEKCEKYNLDGVLIGRASFGNPWVFNNKSPEIEDRINLALYHCKKFEELYGLDHFYVMRKHLAWYIKGISGAKEVRKKLMLSNSPSEVREIIANCELRITD